MLSCALSAFLAALNAQELKEASEKASEAVRAARQERQEARAVAEEDPEPPHPFALYAPYQVELALQLILRSIPPADALRAQLPLEKRPKGGLSAGADLEQALKGLRAELAGSWDDDKPARLRALRAAAWEALPRLKGAADAIAAHPEAKDPQAAAAAAARLGELAGKIKTLLDRWATGLPSGRKSFESLKAQEAAYEFSGVVEFKPKDADDSAYKIFSDFQRTTFIAADLPFREWLAINWSTLGRWERLSLDRFSFSEKGLTARARLESDPFPVRKFGYKIEELGEMTFAPGEALPLKRTIEDPKGSREFRITLLLAPGKLDKPAGLSPLALEGLLELIPVGLIK